MNTQTDLNQLSAIASRLREMREILGWTTEDMAEKTEVSVEEYERYEAGRTDMPSLSSISPPRPSTWS